jgi:CHAT domain-containing protein
MRLTLGALVFGVFLSGWHARGEAPAAADARNVAEVRRLIDVVADAQDVEARIDAARAALKLEPRIKKWTFQYSRAWFRGTLLRAIGKDLQRRPTGNHEDNLDQAIAAYQESLRTLTKAVSAPDWGLTQYNLGDAYLGRRREGAAVNQERAIAAFLAALTVYDRGSKQWAELKYKLGIVYGDRERGDKSDNHAKAIEAYQDTLRVYTRENSPEWFGATRWRLGQELIERAGGSADIETAVGLLEDTVQGLSRQDFPELWGELQFALGRAYDRRVAADRADNLERAIDAYEKALASGTPGSESWARTQVNLAAAYGDRIRGDRADNIERAIKGYEAALNVFTREASPDDWAHFQDMLGNAYRSRIRGDRADNLETAIGLHQNALTVYKRERTPREWAFARANLAGGYLRRRIGAPAENSREAIEGLEAAMTVLTREAAPLEWAGLQDNLGAAYIERPDGDHAENQERGIAAYEAALSVYTRQAAPEDWAHAKANLAKAYAYRIRGDVQDNYRRAIEASLAAIEVYSLQAHPSDFLEQVRLLGPMYIETKNLPAAASIYADARKAFLLQFGGGLDDAQARDVLTNVGPLFSESAYVAAEQGETARALALLNEGKARLMAAALRQLALDLPPEGRARYRELQSDVRRWSAAAATETGAAGIEAVRNLVASRDELLGLIDKGSAAATGSGEIMDWIGPLVPDGGAIVAPIVTFFGGRILIVTRAAGGPVISVVPLPDLTTPAVRDLLGRSVDADGSWLSSYAKNYEMQVVAGELADLREQYQGSARANDQDDSAGRAAVRKKYEETYREYERLDREWRGAIDKVGADMWRLFAGALDRALGERGVAPGAQIVWLPPGGLGVLPLGLARDPAGGQRFGDRYAIAYAPSLVALRVARDELARPFRPSLAAIANPTGNLQFAGPEAAIVAGHFDAAARIVLEQDAATPQAVVAALQDRTYWHFSTHGTFSWRSALDSALILSDGSGARAPLTMQDLLQVQGIGRPRMVVLSACETGFYDSRSNPEEFTGLPNAFMSLGATGVLATLWQVEDSASMLLVAKFYDLHLRDGLAPPEALRRAQGWLRGASAEDLVAYAQDAAKAARIGSDDVARLVASLRRGGVAPAPAASGAASDAPPFADPYYWGAFIYTGL